MKKLYAVVAVLVVSLTLGVTAMAQGKRTQKGSPQTGCASCNTACATPEQMKKFKADSIDLRQEMMNKRFDLQREELKETPDAARVAAVKADIDAIKVRIDALKTAAKLPDCSGRCLENCALMDCSNCMNGKGCACRQCDCKDCRNGKGCATAGNCAHCRNSADCGCAMGGKDCACGPDCTCSNCVKARKGTKAGCKNCNMNRGSRQ